MCGIYAEEELPLSTLVHVQAVLQEMKHRGPDLQTTVSHGSLHVGFARLSLINTHAPQANQPHITGRGRVLAFNGEIYNYKDLLLSAPSEAQLLGQMLDEGMDPRQFVDGDYGILYWNPSQSVLSLYRDRFGVVPLYYQVHPHVAVSSERRRLTQPKEVPAHGKVVIDVSSRRVLEHSAIPHYGITCAPGIHDAKILRTLLLEAVATRALHSDTGFSCALSGGLDSAAVLLACKALGLHPQQALVVAPPFDSRDLQGARTVARACGVDLKEIRVTDEMLREDVRGILEHLDHPRPPTPLKWRASVRVWYVAKEAPTRAVLCGEGADEVFEGYPPHTQRLKDTTYRLARRQLTTIKSLSSINLDRTNKMGLAHSKEFRAPFLASTLSYWLLATQRHVGKQLLREVLKTLGAPPSLLSQPKWGDDEAYLDQTFQRIYPK